MQSRWNDTDALEFSAEAEAAGLPAALGQRLYSARLIGAEPDLALHGGASLSAKITDADGQPALHLAPFGSDPAALALSDLPPIPLAPLAATRDTARLPAAEAEALLATGNADAPPLPAEALLHAQLPHAVIDLTHPAAILALVNQPDMRETVARIGGGRLAFVPYAPPGHALGQACLQALAEAPRAEGIWLEQHGLITFGEDAAESYGRLIRLVTLAEDHLATHGATLAGPEPSDLSPPEDLTQALRAALASREHLGKRPALVFRSSPAIRRWLAREDLAALTRRGPVTPLRVRALRPFALIVPADAVSVAIDLALLDHEQDYRNWFNRNKHHADDAVAMRDALPRAVLVPDLGVYGIGRDEARATRAADLLAQTARIVNAAEDYGRFAPATEPDLFQAEYAPPPLPAPDAD